MTSAPIKPGDLVRVVHDAIATEAVVIGVRKRGNGFVGIDLNTDWGARVAGMVEAGRMDELSRYLPQITAASIVLRGEIVGEATRDWVSRHDPVRLIDIAAADITASDLSEDFDPLAFMGHARAYLMSVETARANATR